MRVGGGSPSREARNDRAERQKGAGVGSARQFDAVLVSELTHWGRSTMDLLETLQTLHLNTTLTLIVFAVVNLWLFRLGDGAAAS
jgi:hypothetical protein